MIYALPGQAGARLLTKRWQFPVTGLLLQRPCKMGMIDQNICQPKTATRSEQRRGDNPDCTQETQAIFFGSLD
jgi:hypothetical protein